MKCRLAAGADEHGRRSDRRELAFQLEPRTQRVQRHGDEPGAEHGQVGHDEVPVVGTDDANPVAGLQAEGDQPATQVCDLVA